MAPPRIPLRLLSGMRLSSAGQFNRRTVTSALLSGAKLFVTFHLVANYICILERTTGVSMVPTIPYEGAWIFVSKLHRRGRAIQVGDVITFAHPVNPNMHAAKRVIGMPGDFVSVVTQAREDEDLDKRDEEGEWARVREEVIRVPEGHCWVAGDNLEWSRDSRLFGPLPLGLVKGKVLAVVTPWRERKWLGADTDIQDFGGDVQTRNVKV